MDILFGVVLSPIQDHISYSGLTTDSFPSNAPSFILTKMAALAASVVEVA
jgi:hypothetical protein